MSQTLPAWASSLSDDVRSLLTELEPQFDPDDLSDLSIAEVSGFVDKYEKLLAPLLKERQRQGTSGSNTNSQEVDAGHPATTSLLHNQDTLKVILDWRLLPLTVFQSRYIEAEENILVALDSFIAHADRALAFFRAVKQLGVDQNGIAASKIDEMESALVDALTKRLFQQHPPPPAVTEPPRVPSTTAPFKEPLTACALKPSPTAPENQAQSSFGDASGSDLYGNVPLPSGTKAIRLLHLYPGAMDETIVCKLQVADLGMDPVYDKAVSYVWGEPVRTTPIWVNETAVPVTVNLAAALRRLRHRTEVRCLWADAVCINQTDLDEKQKQVALMQNIYSNARTVAMWLGDLPKKAMCLPVECSAQLLFELEALLGPVISALSPYFAPTPTDTGLRTYSTSDFYNVLGTLPEECCPDWVGDIRTHHDHNHFYTPLKRYPLSWVDLSAAYQDLFSFGHWAESSSQPKLPSFNWDTKGSVAEILRSSLDARQWPVVGALAILVYLAHGTHFDDLPFFKKGETWRTCGRQCWLKSLSALKTLLQNPYWERSWIQQEVLLAKRPVLYYGPHTIPFRHVVLAVLNFMAHAVERPEGVSGHYPISAITGYVSEDMEGRWIANAFINMGTVFQNWLHRQNDSSASARRQDLGSLLIARRIPRKSTDPRDIVYSLLGLIHNDTPMRIDPNYELTAAAVYAKATLRIMQECGCFEISYHTDWRTDNTLDLPSWSRDWRREIASTCMAAIACEPRSTTALNWDRKLQDDLCLSMSSCQVDVVERTSPLFNACLPEEFCRQAQSWFAVAFPAAKGTDDVAETGPDQQAMHHFFRALLSCYTHAKKLLDFSGDPGTKYRIDDGILQRIGAWWDWLVRFPVSRAGENDELLQQWTNEGKQHAVIHNLFETSVTLKRFFVTKSGRFGLGPSCTGRDGQLAWPTVLEGDEIHVLQGCGLPVLLRSALRWSKTMHDDQGRASAPRWGQVPKNHDSDYASDHDLTIEAGMFSAPLQNCYHARNRVYQFSGLCEIDGLQQEGLEAEGTKLTFSEIFLR